MSWPREIDAQHQGRPGGVGRLPRLQLEAGRAEHEQAERLDEPGVLGEGDDVARGHEPELRVCPAQQRFEAGDRSAGEGDDRLEMNVDLVVLEGLAQRLLQRQAPHHLRVHGVIEQAITGPAGGLGPVHGRVGVADDVGRRIVALPAGGDADAARELELLLVHGDRPGDRFEDTLGHAGGVLLLAQVLQQHQELVAADP